MEIKSEKESMLTALCFVVGLLLLSTAIFDYLNNDLQAIDLFTLFAVFLMLISLGLVPKFFFTPLNQLLCSSYKLPTLINAKIQKMLLLAGMGLFVGCLLWQNFV